jgi:hypothetical protein
LRPEYPVWRRSFKPEKCTLTRLPVPPQKTRDFGTTATDVS